VQEQRETSVIRETLRLLPECLTEGDASPVIVVVDFLPFSPMKRVGQLLTKHAADRTIYQIDPVADLATSDCYLTLDQLAAQYSTSLLADTDRRSMKVVGYCSATPLALRVTEIVAATRDASLALLSPTLPTIDMVATEYSRFRTDLGAATDVAFKFDYTDSRAALSAMVRALSEDLRAMAAANGLDVSSSILDELLGRYRSWLGFLLASADFAPETVAGKFPVKLLIGPEDEPAGGLDHVRTAETRLGSTAGVLDDGELLTREILTSDR